MIVPFILTLLQPLCPALFLRETVRWLIGSVGAWLIDEDYAGWLKESGDRNELRALLSFVLMIEEGLSLLVYVRARQKLGHKARPGRKLARRPNPAPGHPPSFDDICRRFERACLRFTDIERLADKRAQKLKRLLDTSACRLDALHRLAASTIPTIFQTRSIPTIPTTTIFQSGAATTIFASSATIRGPPRAPLDLSQSSSIPTRRPHLRERETMLGMTPPSASRSADYHRNSGIAYVATAPSAASTSSADAMNPSPTPIT